MNLVQHHRQSLDTQPYRSSSLDRMDWKSSNLRYLIRTFENDREKSREVQNFLTTFLLDENSDDDEKIVISLPRGMRVLSKRNKNIQRWCETWTSAMFCVQRRLRTQFGKAEDLFEKLENAVIRSVKKDGCSPKSAYLLEFADAMDKLIYLAHTGTIFTTRDEQFVSSILYSVPSQNCTNFFQKNRKVCEYWMSRMRRHLQRLALKCGASFASARYGLLQLSGSTISWGTDENTVRNLVMSLYRMGDSDAIGGVKEFFQEQLKSSVFDETCVHVILRMSQGHYEIAFSILKSLLMKKDQNYNAEARQFLAARLIECASHLRTNLECAWQIVQENISLSESFESALKLESQTTATKAMSDLSLWEKQQTGKLRNISILGVSNVIESLRSLRDQYDPIMMMNPVATTST